MPASEPLKFQEACALEGDSAMRNDALKASKISCKIKEKHDETSNTQLQLNEPN